MKKFFSNTYNKIILVLGALVGFLFYYISLKNKKINAYKAQIKIAKTQKEVDAIEFEIKERMNNSKLLRKEREDLEKALKEIDSRRKKLKKSSKSKKKKKTDKQKKDYWNKK